MHSRVPSPSFSSRNRNTERGGRHAAYESSYQAEEERLRHELQRERARQLRMDLDDMRARGPASSQLRELSESGIAVSKIQAAESAEKVSIAKRGVMLLPAVPLLSKPVSVPLEHQGAGIIQIHPSLERHAPRTRSDGKPHASAAEASTPAGGAMLSTAAAALHSKVPSEVAYLNNERTRAMDHSVMSVWGAEIVERSAAGCRNPQCNQHRAHNNYAMPSRTSAQTRVSNRSFVTFSNW